MKPGISLSELNAEVQRQAAARVDYLINTQASLRILPMKDMDKGVALVSLDEGATELQRWALTDTAHDQIASWLEIPRKYYDRLLVDHLDMLCDNVNKLFEREPGTRMVRTLDGRCRAFMSDRYRRLDNDSVLAAVLPQVLGAGDSGQREHMVLQSTITDKQMALSVVFTDPSLAQIIGKTNTGVDDVVHPGFKIGNSETGRGSLNMKGFFYRTYCMNGCVWAAAGTEIEFQRNHSGGKLTADMERVIFTDETRKADDRALMLSLRDMIKGMGSPQIAQQMGDALRELKTGEKITRPQAAIEVLARQVGLQEGEKEAFLMNLIKEADLTRYGALNAITAIANSAEVSDDRAHDLQEIGGSLITMTQHQWNQIARAEKVPVAA
jgi:hypothetical protein